MLATTCRQDQHQLSASCRQCTALSPDQNLLLHAHQCKLQCQSTINATISVVQAMRLFVGEPVWTPYNRPQDDMPSRKKYVDNFLSSMDKAKPQVTAENNNKGARNTKAAQDEEELIEDSSSDLKRKQQPEDTTGSKVQKVV